MHIARMRASLAAPVVVALWLGTGCKGPTPIEQLRDALADDSLERVNELTKTVPACVPPVRAPPPQGCLPESATALGSKTGFSVSPPDQASAAAVALLLVIAKRGDWVPLADSWIDAMKIGKGAGADALRLSVARGMAEVAATVGKPVLEDVDAVALLKAIATAIPGACATYAALGDGAAEEKLPPEMTPDHDPCVQKDLGRKEGPGGKYGVGLWRGAAGAVALWKEEIVALKTGMALMEGKPKETLAKKLAVIESATSKSTLKPSAPRVNEAIDLAVAHAGVLKAGANAADGGVDAGKASDAGASKKAADAGK